MRTNDHANRAGQATGARTSSYSLEARRTAASHDGRTPYGRTVDHRRGPDGPGAPTEG
ncbi:hypothetical protein [Streptomyces wuyuanensis]|uniref:hypothetical protein n=1 Tax=Streptomyces wuyuanensis TaxID=1196353 RepID=UPI003D712DC3